jgi:tetratricopeptide (TPR) repeat protein
MVIPGFRVTGELGRTASGIVHLAESERLGQPVALKVLEPPRSVDPESRERFLAGARRQAALAHPHVVHVVEFGVADGLAYVATDCCRGGDLDDRIARGMTVRELAGALGDIARALDAVHAEGLVHRDVSPGNILFREDGTAQLNDFDIALEAGTGPSVSAAGTVLGSPGYMSPEQVTGATLDGRADLYSLGAVLFRALAGTAAFPGDDAAAIASRQLTDPVPRLPPHLEALQPVVDRALAKLPAERYPDGAAFAAALSAACTGSIGNVTLRSAPVSVSEIRAVGSALLADAPHVQRPARPRKRWRDRRSTRVAAAVLVVVAFGWWLSALVERSETAARVLAVVGITQDPAVREAWDAARTLDQDPNTSLATVVAAYRRVLSLEPGHRRAQEALDDLATEWKSSVERALAQGNVSSAADRLGDYLRVFPSDPLVAELSERISSRRTADTLVNNALAELRKHGVGDLATATLAIRSYQEVLRLVPEHPVAQTELDVIAEYYAGRAADAAASGDVDDAIGYLDRASSANANLPRLEEIRAQVRGGRATEAAIGEILAEASRLRDAGALIDPPGANAAELYHRVLATDPENAAARTGVEAVVGQLIASIKHYLNAGDLVSAGELVARAGELGLDQAAVAGTRVELEQELQRFNAVVRNLEDASALLERGLITEPQERNAVLLLREVEALDPGNRTGRVLLERAARRLAEVAEEAHELGMKRTGREYLALALTVTPGVESWERLLERWERDD